MNIIFKHNISAE